MFEELSFFFVSATTQLSYYPRTPQDMDGALHTDFPKFETNSDIKTIISPFVYL